MHDPTENVTPERIGSAHAAVLKNAHTLVSKAGEEKVQEMLREWAEAARLLKEGRREEGGDAAWRALMLFADLVLLCECGRYEGECHCSPEDGCVCMRAGGDPAERDRRWALENAVRVPGN